MILLVTSVNADAVSDSLVSKTVAYWKLNNTMTDNAHNYWNLTDTNTADVEGYLGRGREYDNIADKISQGTMLDTIPASWTSITYSAWINITSCPSALQQLFWKSNVDLRDRIQVYMDNTCLINYATEEHNAGINTITATNSLPTNEWVHIVSQWSETVGKQIWINGILNVSDGGETTLMANGADQNFNIGAGPELIHGIHGTMDEVAVFNETLNASEIARLYSGVTYPYLNATPPVSPSCVNITIKARNNETSVALNTFNVSIWNNTINYTLSTTNGTIKTNISNCSSTLFDLRYRATNYFDLNNNNVNITTAPVWGNLTPYLQVFAHNNYTLASINVFNVTWNSNTYLALAGVAYLPIRGGNANLSVDSGLYEVSNYTNWNTNNDLNASLIFWYVNETSYSSPVLELQNQTITLIINTTSKVSSTTASLTWDDTSKSVTKTVYASYTLFSSTFLTPKMNATRNATINWNFNVTHINSSTLSLEHNDTQLVIIIGIDNCSTYSMMAVNITIRDESNNSPEIGFIDGYFQAWIDDIGEYRNFNLSWSGSSTYGICINPNSSTYIASAQMGYGAGGYETKTYYFINTSLNNVTDTLDLYLTLNTTVITLTVTDQNDNPVEDAYIYILSYDLPTDSYLTTEIVNTDFNGQALAEMIMYTQWYKFIIIYDGETVLETTETKILSTSLNFRINLLENYFTNYDIVQDITCSIGFNTVTNNFNYVFNDPSGNTVSATLIIKRVEPFSETIVNQSTLSSSGGTILLHVTPSNHTFLATGSVLIDGVEYACGIPYSHDFASTITDWGTEGLFLAVLIILVLVLVGIWNPIVAIFLMIIGVVFTVILGNFYLSIPILISFIVIGGVAMYRLNK